MHEGNYRPISCFDPQTGELTLRCLDGLVNNFNQTILDCIRCNMDIKFIGSGVSAKAILYYITDYITKSQLKTHVAYAALELAIARLGEYDPTDNDLTYHAKRLLQRCAYAMISHQELSAPQVAAYLMDYGDHFTSHKFAPFYWTTAETYVNKQIPLSTPPSCQPSVVSPDLAPEFMNVDDENRENDEPVTSLEDINVDGVQPHGTDNTYLALHTLSDSSWRVTSADDSESLSPINQQDGESLESDNPDQGEPTTQPAIDQDPDEDVTLYMDANKNLAVRMTPFDNYLHRSNELADLCYWDYVSRVEKVSKASDRRKHKKADHRFYEGFERDNRETVTDVTDVESDDEQECSDDGGQEPDDNGVPCLWDLHLHPNKHLKSTKRRRPRVEFLQEHPESFTHYQKVQLHANRLVPVPVGPFLPQRDRDDSKERHARLMLILLKPWSTVNDLKPSDLSWIDAYTHFTNTCHPRILQIITNMQLLHECRDSRDDHFAKR